MCAGAHAGRFRDERFIDDGYFLHSYVGPQLFKYSGYLGAARLPTEPALLMATAVACRASKLRFASHPSERCLRLDGRL